MLEVGLLWTLPLGIGLSLIGEGIDRYGRSSWPASLAVAALFGVLFGVRGWRSARAAAPRRP